MEEIKYERRENSKGESGEYLIAKNETGEQVAFKMKDLNVKIWTINDWTMEIAKIAASNNLELLGKYLQILVKSEGFRFYCLMDLFLLAAMESLTVIVSGQQPNES